MRAYHARGHPAPHDDIVIMHCTAPVLLPKCQCSYHTSSSGCTVSGRSCLSREVTTKLYLYPCLPRAEAKGPRPNTRSPSSFYFAHHLELTFYCLSTAKYSALCRSGHSGYFKNRRCGVVVVHSGGAFVDCNWRSICSLGEGLNITNPEASCPLVLEHILDCARRSPRHDFRRWLSAKSTRGTSPALYVNKVGEANLSRRTSILVMIGDA